MRFYPLLFCALLFITTANAQATRHVQWEFAAVQKGPGKVSLEFTAIVEPSWHIYSKDIPKDGPKPTTFKFAASDAVKLIGGIGEKGNPVKSYDENFMVDVIWFTESVIFYQLIEVLNDTEVKGVIEFMVCNADTCVPGKKSFNIVVKK